LAILQLPKGWYSHASLWHYLCLVLRQQQIIVQHTGASQIFTAFGWLFDAPFWDDSVNQFTRQITEVSVQMHDTATYKDVIGFWDGLSPRNVWEGLFLLEENGKRAEGRC
jgi:hypothetical protein